MKTTNDTKKLLTDEAYAVRAIKDCRDRERNDKDELICHLTPTFDAVIVYYVDTEWDMVDAGDYWHEPEYERHDDLTIEWAGIVDNTTGAEYELDESDFEDFIRDYEGI